MEKLLGAMVHRRVGVIVHRRASMEKDYTINKQKVVTNINRADMTTAKGKESLEIKVRGKVIHIGLVRMNGLMRPRGRSI